MTIRPVFGQEGDHDCQYCFRTLSGTWNSNWQDSGGAVVHTQALLLPETFLCRARTKIGKVLQMESIGITVN